MCEWLFGIEIDGPDFDQHAGGQPGHFGLVGERGGDHRFSLSLGGFKYLSP
jgi:hypothetical protein